MKRTLLLLALPVALSAILSAGGCAFGGKDKFACSGYPSRPLCLPPSQIYRLTEGAGPPPAAMQSPAQSRHTGSSQPEQEGVLVWGN